jgi:regulator of replication initiation timing
MKTTILLLSASLLFACAVPAADNLDAVKREIEELKRRVTALEADNAKLRRQVESLSARLQATATKSPAESNRAAAVRKACMAFLQNIKGAKDLWALEEKQADDATPTDADLFGPGKTLRQKPRCPGGGTYFLGKVAEKPSCSEHGKLE